MAINKLGAAIAAGTVAAAVSFGVGTGYHLNDKPRVVTRTVIKHDAPAPKSGTKGFEFDGKEITLPTCGELDDNCYLPWDINAIESKPFAGKNIVVYRGRLYVETPDITDGGE